MRAAVPVVMRAAWQRSRCHMGLRRPLRTAAISTRMADVVVPGTEAPAGAAPEEDGKTPADMDRLNGFVDGPSVAFWRAPSRPSLAGRRRAPGPGVSAHPGPWWPCTDAGRIGTRRASTPSQTFPATWHRCSRPPSASQSGLLSLCPFPQLTFLHHIQGRGVLGQRCAVLELPCGAKPLLRWAGGATPWLPDSL